MLPRTRVNAALEYLTDAVSKLFSYLAPSVTFGLYAGAEMLFIYGVYRVLCAPHDPGLPPIAHFTFLPAPSP
jgi:hypothetical protein